MGKAKSKKHDESVKAASRQSALFLGVAIRSYDKVTMSDMSLSESIAEIAVNLGTAFAMGYEKAISDKKGKK